MQFITYLLLCLPAVLAAPLPQRCPPPANTGGSGLLGNGVNVDLLSFKPDVGPLFGGKSFREMKYREEMY